MKNQGDIMENKEELDLRDLFGFIKKRVWLIVIITLLTTLISAVISVFIISPTYEAKVGILIGKQQDGNKITDSDVNMYQNLMQTYKDIAETNKVAKMAAEKLDNGLSVKDLLKRTTVTVETGTMILYIGSKSNGAAEVYKEVQAYADAFIEIANTLIPDGNVKIMDYALVPDAPTSPDVYLNTAIGFIAGLLLSVFISFLLEYMNNTIVTKEDAEKYLELPVIGIIPENNIE
jgi:capsular polysaccharide biosynthesis protein